MNFNRLATPEENRNQESSFTERSARKLGGYTLGVLGFATGIGAVSGILTTGGLSLPVLGGLSGAFMGGSRALLRPAYQDDSDYEDVKNETTKEKSLRISAFIGGMALWSVGSSVLLGGLFNSAGSAPSRLVRTTVGWIGSVMGARFVRGSFDPDLNNDLAVLPPQKSLRETIRSGYNEGLTRYKLEHAQQAQAKRIHTAKLDELTSEFRSNVIDIQDRFLADGATNSTSFKQELDQLLAEHRQETDELFREYRTNRLKTHALAA